MSTATATDDRIKQLRLQLTQEERERALDIKDMIEMTPEMHGALPDFWYAQFGLVVKDDVAEAVRRALQLQAFREAYDIRDTAQQARQLLQKFVEVFPGHLLHVAMDKSKVDVDQQQLQEQDQPQLKPDLGSCFLVIDGVQLHSSGLDTDQKMKDFMGAVYYINQASNVDCEAVRRGSTVLYEFEGFSYYQKPNLKVLTKLFSELFAAYPTNGCIRGYRTGVLANITVSVLRKIVPSLPVQAGLQSEGGRFDKIYLTPNLATANQRLLGSFTEFLEWRYETERVFTLALPDQEEEPIRYEDL